MRSAGPAVLSLLLAYASAAQTTPPPTGAFPAPLTGYVGRYLDSAQTPHPSGSEQLITGRTRVVPDRDLILMNLGDRRVGAYRMSTFAQRARSGPLMTGPNGATYLPPDRFTVAPQEPGSGWITTPVSYGDPIEDFDNDDRGYIYIAMSAWGLGIVDEAGAKQSQIFPPISAFHVVALRDGARVLALVGTTTDTGVYDVSDPSAPVLVRTLPFGIAAHAKLSSGRVGVLDVFPSELRIYASAHDLATGQPPVQTFNPQPGLQYAPFMATDGTSTFTMATDALPNSPTYLSVVAPSGSQYVETRHPTTPALLPFDITYGAGFVTVSGFTSLAPMSTTGALYRVDPFEFYDISDYVRTGDHGAPGSGIGPSCLAPYVVDGQPYLIAGLGYLGELFTLDQAAATPAAVPALSFVALLVFGVLVTAIAVLRLR